MKPRSERYRLNRRGDVVLDERTFSETFLDPHGTSYTSQKRGKGLKQRIDTTQLFEPRRSSPARVRFHAERVERRKAARNAAANTNTDAMKQVHAAAVNL